MKGVLFVSVDTCILIVREHSGVAMPERETERQKQSCIMHPGCRLHQDSLQEYLLCGGCFQDRFLAPAHYILLLNMRALHCTIRPFIAGQPLNIGKKKSPLHGSSTCPLKSSAAILKAFGRKTFNSNKTNK